MVIVTSTTSTRNLTDRFQQVRQTGGTEGRRRDGRTDGWTDSLHIYLLAINTQQQVNQTQEIEYIMLQMPQKTNRQQTSVAAYLGKNYM